MYIALLPGIWMRKSTMILFWVCLTRLSIRSCPSVKTTGGKHICHGFGLRSLWEMCLQTGEVTAANVEGI